ncbi:MAG: mandelate racemase/muconate lactonizing enzyme family protein [Pseudomonadota bacterium]
MRAPIKTPRRNAFGVQTARHALFVELTLADGTTGWGEAFCNWPHFAALHRARIVEDVLAPLVSDRGFFSPEHLWHQLAAKTASLSIQCAEPGPFHSAIAAVEIAAWNAVAQGQGRSLADILGGGLSEPIAYASGLTGGTLETTVPRLIEAGWTAFKLKVGFGRDQDEAAVGHLRQLVGPGATIMVDANMAWDLPQAGEAVGWLADYDVRWIEEPISAEQPGDAWRRLADSSSVPLAAGENHRGIEAFEALIGAGIGIIQPDPVKWGGLSNLLRIARMCSGCNVTFAPHFLGGGVGLEATFALAKASGAGFVEIDVTENPLRDAIWEPEHDGGAFPCFGSQGAPDPARLAGFIDDQWHSRI